MKFGAGAASTSFNEGCVVFVETRIEVQMKMMMATISTEQDEDNDHNEA